MATGQLGFECESSGSRPPANISWFLDGQPVDRSFSQVAFDGNLSRSVLLLPASERPGKLLECRAANRNLPGNRGVLSRFSKVDLSLNPEVSLRLGAGLNASHIIEGTDVYMECFIVAVSSITEVAWTHEGGELREGSAADGALVASRYLVIRNVTKSHGGRYTCRATSVHGDQVESDPFYLRVQHAPICKRRRDRQLVVRVNENVNVTCDVDADPSDNLVYSWVVEDDFDKKKTVRANDKSSNRVSILVEPDLYHGALFCWAENAVGVQKHRCRFNFLLRRTTGHPLTCTVGNYTDTSFTLTCRAPENVSRLRLELYDATMNNRSERSFWTTGPAQVQVEKLKPATDYLVAVRASGYSFDTFVRTLAPAQTLKDRPDSQFKRMWTTTPTVVIAMCGGAGIGAVLLGLCSVLCFKRHRKRARRRDAGSTKHQEHEVYKAVDVS